MVMASFHMNIIYCIYANEDRFDPHHIFVHDTVLCNKSNVEKIIPVLATFLTCLVLSLQLGSLLGIGVNILFILRHAPHPTLRAETISLNVFVVWRRQRNNNYQANPK
uniref:Uncharacterized protein n=1 Tax=Glossina brevipalpis TaxID=37001 RepID=A0A1A9WL96_9MUSC